MEWEISAVLLVTGFMMVVIFCVIGGAGRAPGDPFDTNQALLLLPLREDAEKNATLLEQAIAVAEENGWGQRVELLVVDCGMPEVSKQAVQLFQKERGWIQLLEKTELPHAVTTLIQ